MNDIKRATEKYKDICAVDPLLIAAIISVESSSDPYAMSWVGAGGILQIMPETAKEHGFNVIITDNFKQGWKEWRKYIDYYKAAIRHFKRNDFELAKTYKITSKKFRDKALNLFKEYKKEVLTQVKGKSPEEILKIDQRFHVPSAIDFCVETIANALKNNNEDYRLAFASYNAGIGAVRKYKGVPPYDQTVHYQNKVMNTYWILEERTKN